MKANRQGHSRKWLAEQLGRQLSAIKHKITELQALKFKRRVYQRRAVVVPDGQKLCRECGLIKPLSDFHRQTKAPDGRQHRCKACAIKLAIRWNRDHPEVFARNKRTYHLRKTYGLSREMFESLLERQNGACPICLAPLNGQIHVDHDHETGTVRGLLHSKCNAAVGALGDSIERLKRAIAYLEGALTN